MASAFLSPDDINKQVNNDIVPIVIVGSGPVGVHFLKAFLSHNPHTPVIIYGNEPWLPYHREQLSSFIAGDIDWSVLVDTQALPFANNVSSRFNSEITSIDTANKLVIEENGYQQKYDKLILATGSRPRIPSFAGVRLKNVFTFRDLNDAEQLVARRVRSRRTVVIGGGILGLEAARAMTRYHTEVFIIEHSNRLMGRQLDKPASELLREHILSLGIRVHLSSSVKQICGDAEVNGVLLQNGTHIICDTVIIATGIKPNKELALAAGIKVGRGIKVNNAMQTSKQDIYAIGECAEHNGRIYDLVTPGYEQACVAAYNIAGHRSRYHGTIAGAQLKVVGQTVFSMGELDNEIPDYNLHSAFHENSSRQVYRKLVLRRRRLVGVIAVGEWPGLNRIREAVLQRRILWPWDIKRFCKTGEVWPDTVHVNQWPHRLVVCDCCKVTRGECTRAIAAGCHSVTEIGQHTGAATVCESCKPLLQEMLSGTTQTKPVHHWQTTLTVTTLSLLGILLCIKLLPFTSVENIPFYLHWHVPLQSHAMKQVSVYATLGLSTVGLVVSLLTGIRKLKRRDLSIWRGLHLFTGTLLLLLPVSGTDRLLNLLVLALVVPGIITTLLLKRLDKLSTRAVLRRLQRLKWLHIVAFWLVITLLWWHSYAIFYLT